MTFKILPTVNGDLHGTTTCLAFLGWKKISLNVNKNSITLGAWVFSIINVFSVIKIRNFKDLKENKILALLFVL